ncbi:N-formylglutamate amidohydrolase [Sphingomonas sp. ID1715]|nr:N-formylglutamate amidohydrolase [Sphingomonas sp. ID1715]
MLSVPHAGRDYSPAHRALVRPPVERLLALEDRLVDELVRNIPGAPVLIANAPRAWIDLNRHEAEIDPGLVDGAVASRLMLTAKVRSGLGLVPRRLAGVGEIWRGRLPLAAVEARLAELHRPYHAALRGLLQESLDAHGTAILLDIHSMPPLSSGDAQLVIGNRFGQSAATWVSASVARTCTRLGLSWQENTPYPGGHIVERHGAPARGIHAVQLEFDRTLYLDDEQRECDPLKLERTRRILSEIVADVKRAALDEALPLAAE